MSTRRVVTALLAMMLGTALISVMPEPMAAFADPGPAGSAMTKSGTGEFNKLAVTVSQTKNLINQVITVSWAGGVPTTPVGGKISANFLQIMQCWGDDPNGPDRTQCQFGASNTQQGGEWTQSRQVSYGASLIDHEETFKLPSGNAFVPFWPVGKDKPTDAATGDNNDFFDSQITNEDSLARTHADGTGLEYFEVQTVRQAAGLGCGDPVTVGGVTKGRSCWLVIVPRGNTEVDGSTRIGDVSHPLDSSPLSQTNWDKRIVFPLEFLPVGQACPAGAPERRIIGNELVTDAIGSWQPALCTGGGALYSYTQLVDDVARNQLLAGTAGGMALVTNPIPPDQAPADHPLVYAPVGLSGLVIAFNIDRQPPDPDPGVPATPEQQLAGQRFTSMKLTPRLVAKLLTQSYLGAVQVPSDSMKPHNAQGLLTDPEFLDLNPEYKGSVSSLAPGADALVQLGTSDVTSLLWSWVKADPDASAFIAGTPDPNGMVVNPNNQNLSLPTSTFPRNDESCTTIALGGLGGPTGQLCTQDAHPFTVDMHDAGRSASRGDSQARTLVLGSDLKTPTTSKIARQQAGQQALLAVVDAATAARYSLPTVELRNASGQFVAPTTASLQAGAAAMKLSAVAGVLASDSGAKDPAAYPLPALAYAATSPSTLDAAAGKDYAAFLRYAAGPGQQPGIEPGQLPPGMAPLPDKLKAQTMAAAATIEAQAGKPPPGSPVQQQTRAATGNGTTSGGLNSGSNTGSNATAGTAGAGTTAGSGSAASGTPAVAGTANGSSKTSSVAQQVAGLLRRTPALPAPVWVGGLLLALLICGGLAATSSPVLQSPAIHWLRAVVRRRLRKEVTPTEQ